MTNLLSDSFTNDAKQAVNDCCAATGRALTCCLEFFKYVACCECCLSDEALRKRRMEGYVDVYNYPEEFLIGTEMDERDAQNPGSSAKSIVTASADSLYNDASEKPWGDRTTVRNGTTPRSQAFFQDM